MGHRIICPWSELENIIHQSLLQGDRRGMEKKLSIFFKEHSRHKTFWHSVFLRNEIVGQLFETPANVKEGPTAGCAGQEVRENTMQNKEIYILQEKLEKAISVVNYLENENEALHEELQKQTTENF